MKHQHQSQYTYSLVPYARRMRRAMTEAEAKIWCGLRASRLGVKFRRQVPYGPYILDFFSIKARLDVEVDGSQHHRNKGQAHDRERDAYLRKEGIEVIRFDDADALANTHNVVNAVFQKVQARLRENWVQGRA